jgi:hypothetical protein
MFLKKINHCFFLAISLFLSISSFASIAYADLRLNYEAAKVRGITEKQIELMKTLKEVLQFCEIVFPIQMQAEVTKKGIDISVEKIYRKMLASKSSGEVFRWYREFLSENETLREILNKHFFEANPVDERKAIFRLGTAEFSVRWFWLYPTKDGLTLTAQDEMTQTIADEIWRTGVFRYVLEIRFPLPENLHQNPFWEKGTVKIFKSFPSACFSEDSLVYMVFPSSSALPSIIQRSLELID